MRRLISPIGWRLQRKSSLDRYENLQIIPSRANADLDYNAFVNDCDSVLLISSNDPFRIMDLQRPHMVMAFMEHLLREAETIGFEGILRSRIRSEITQRIKELET